MIEFGEKVTSEYCVTRLQKASNVLWTQSKKSIHYEPAMQGRRSTHLCYPYPSDETDVEFLEKNDTFRRWGNWIAWARIPYKVNGVYLGDTTKYDGTVEHDPEDGTFFGQGKRYRFACVAVRTISAPLCIFVLHDDLVSS